jgi:MinD-like ATPase involved in chromosome partitioning or flagellar assembly
LAVALGDPVREQALLPALSVDSDIVITERCLTADQLLASIQDGAIDAAIVAFDLHRLSRNALFDLARFNTPVVLLAPADGSERWQWFSGTVVRLDADSEAIRQALFASFQGKRPGIARPILEQQATFSTIDSQISPSETPPSDAVITVASSHGSPGRTTVAVGLAAGLSMLARAVVVDADLDGPSVAVHLDADPTRNLSMIAHAEPETPLDWERAIAQEIQPLSSEVPSGAALCGIPKPAMRSRISAEFFERLIAELCRQFRYVIIDIGSDVLGPHSSVHRQALRLAHQTFFVASADLPGLWRARTGIDVISPQLQIDIDRISLIVNRHDRHHHHGRSEIEWALGLPTTAVIPFDHAGVQRALIAQRPVVFDRRSRAGKALLELATRIHNERHEMASERPYLEHMHWRRWLPELRSRWPPLRSLTRAAR